MKRSIRWRLNSMMFLEHLIPSATVPILSLYLKDTLGFEAFQIGKVLAMPAVAAIIAPLFIMRLANHRISDERLLSLCNALGGLAMLMLAQQTKYGPFIIWYLIYSLCFAPTFGLTNAIVFHHLKENGRDFGIIRLWGTASCIVVAVIFGFGWLRTPSGELNSGRLQDTLWLSAIVSFVFAAGALALPQSRRQESGALKASPWDALKLYFNGSVARLGILTFLAAVVDRFFYFGAAPFLHARGYADAYIMPAMSLGQVTEVGVMICLGRILARWGFKRVLIAGLLAEVFRYGALAIGKPDTLVLMALASHGLCYALYFAAAFICLDTYCRPGERSGAQQIFAMIFSGGGVLGGSLLAGKLAQWFTYADGAIDYRIFWAVPAAGALLLVFLAAAVFRDMEQAEKNR